METVAPVPVQERNPMARRWLAALRRNVRVATLVSSGVCVTGLVLQADEPEQKSLDRIILAQEPSTRPGGSGQPPRLPETVVPGERTPTTAPGTGESGAPPFPGQGAQGPFGPGGAFSNTIQGPNLPDVHGTEIFGGKKTVNINLGDMPPIVDYNFRRALIKAPGLFYNEESTGLTGIGYRGLNPDRNQYMQIMEDGFPLGANIMGFNESYYIPPLQIVDHIEFVHGGSALLYGPQPGGSLNFVTRDPATDGPFHVYAENSIGSHSLFETFEGITGTVEGLGYNVYGLHRESDGFRRFNSAQRVEYGGAKTIYQIDANSRVIMLVNAYQEHHGEPGRLSRAAFEADPTQSTRPFDFFELNRFFGGLTYQNVLDEQNYFQLKTWGSYFERFSNRQRGGAFGTVPNGTQSDYRLEEFLVFGVEPRYRHDYELFGCEPSSFTVGMLYYKNDGQRKDSRGPVGGPGTVGPEPRVFADRDTDYLSFFAENRFVFGPLSITPGVRVENIWQRVHETVNVDKAAAAVPLGDKKDHDTVPLFGVGAAFEVAPTAELYANLSQSYRPKLFQEFVSPGPTDIVAGDLNPGHAYQGDIGFRAHPTPYWMIDTSLFNLEFKDQIGSVAGVIDNVGDARHQGWEFAAEIDLVALADAHNGGNLADRFGSIGVFYNHMLLDAEFIKGPNTGRTPAYAPDRIIRGGLTYTYRDPECCCAAPCEGGEYSGINTGCWHGHVASAADYAARERVKVWFTGTFVSDHFADDGNTANFFIPSYTIWDLTAEVKVLRDTLTVFGGVYNVFDEKYFAFVRSDGIEPADGRNYFVGFRVYW
jgi:Fe(3+) dicitrate transport protein